MRSEKQIISVKFVKKEGKDTEMSRFALIGKETIASVLPVKYKIQIYFES